MLRQLIGLVVASACVMAGIGLGLWLWLPAVEFLDRALGGDLLTVIGWPMIGVFELIFGTAGLFFGYQAYFQITAGRPGGNQHDPVALRGTHEPAEEDQFLR